MKLSRANRKALRTLLQAAVAALGAGGLHLLFPHWSGEVIGIIGVVLTPLLTQLQNGLEANGTIPVLLPTTPQKTSPDPSTGPTVADPLPSPDVAGQPVQPPVDPPDAGI